LAAKANSVVGRRFPRSDVKVKKMNESSDIPAIESIRQHCASLLPGPVADVSTLELLLAAVWDDFSGDDGGMDAYKLPKRMENPIWNPPILTFRIERHGAASLGSSRAEVQEWTVDLEGLTASVKVAGRRQISPLQPRLDVKPIAADLCSAVLTGKQDDRLKWDGTSKVRVLMGKVLPERSALKETVAYRRKRLRNELTRLLAPEGWKCVRPNDYERE
jgi:hypothetical protein